jgi:phenylacetate-CoA ligase
MEYALTEVVDADGRPLPAGAVGTLVGTTLHNLAMPLIRYVTNDMTSIRGGRCSCGRSLDLMDDVTTKAEDVLTLGDGRLISPSVLTHPFKPLESIEGSQIVQTAPNAITVRLVPGPQLTTALVETLVHDLQERLGPEVRIDVAMVERVEVSANGKFKWVISHVPLEI